MRTRNLASVAAVALVIALALVSCGPSQGQVDQAVNATLTAMAPQMSPTPIVAAVTPAPTQAVIQPPPGDPAATFGKPDGLDTFDNDNNWTTYPPGDNPCFSSEIKNGQFLMTAEGQVGFSCWELTWPKLQNYYVEYKVQMPQTCNANDRFGLLFRAPDNNKGYLYGISCGGVQSFSAWTGSETLQILPAAKSDLIVTTPGAVNRIGIMAQDASFAFYINGIKVTEGLDQTFPGEGKIGFFVNTATKDGFTVAFDDLAVWLLPRP